MVLATGANPRALGLPNEAALTGRGVAYCAACDGMRYKGKTVVVVGGGNSAAADALILSRIAQKVILVHRRDTLRATKVYHRPLMEAKNLEFRWNSVVTELLHGDKLTGVKLKDVNTGEETVLPCDGVFISVGRKPAAELVQGQLELDRSGYVVADETTKTSLPGVYAVGDVRTKPLRQVVTAVADGATAVHMAEEYLAGAADSASYTGMRPQASCLRPLRPLPAEPSCGMMGASQHPYFRKMITGEETDTMPRTDCDTDGLCQALPPAGEQGGEEGPHPGGGGPGDRLAHRIHAGGHRPAGAVRHHLWSLLPTGPSHEP